MAKPGPDHRARHMADLRRMFERFDTAAQTVGAPGSAVRRRYAEEAGILKDAIHYLGADEHLEKAKAVKRTADPTANALIEAMLPDLLIVLACRLGGDVLVPVDEVDAIPKGRRLEMGVDAANGLFRFLVRRV